MAMANRPQALIALALAALLAVSAPAMVFAAGTPSIQFISPVPGATITGTQSYTIAGYVTPAPGVADNVFIEVKNPSGVVVDAASVPVNSSTGAFSYQTAAGGSSNWIVGTYTITASDSYGATGTATFSYAPTPAPTAVTSALVLQAESPVFAGQTAYIYAMVQSAGGLANATFPVAEYFTPSGVSSALGAPVQLATGLYEWSVALPSSAPSGSYLVYVQSNVSGSLANAVVQFTVNNDIASSSSVGSLSSQLSNVNSSLRSAVSYGFSSVSAQIASSAISLSSQLTTMQRSLTNLQSEYTNLSTAVGNMASTINSDYSSLSSSVSSIGSSLGSMSSTLSTISSGVSSIGSSLSSMSSTLSSVQTEAAQISGVYNLVLATIVIAVIVLVLELVVIIRRH
jgi:hypothetical protein